MLSCCLVECGINIQHPTIVLRQVSVASKQSYGVVGWDYNEADCDIGIARKRALSTFDPWSRKAAWVNMD